MSDYLINLLEDATGFSLAFAKASHAILLCRMEQGKFKSSAETDKIDHARRAHVQQHVEILMVVPRKQRKPTEMARHYHVCILTKVLAFRNNQQN